MVTLQCRLRNADSAAAWRVVSVSARAQRREFGFEFFGHGFSSE
jgi:hypothetical protein